MSDLKNFVRIKFWNENRTKGSEYWLIHGKLLNYKLGYIDEEPVGREPIPGYDFSEGSVEIKLGSIHDRIVLFYPQLLDYYESIKPPVAAYFLTSSFYNAKYTLERKKQLFTSLSSYGEPEGDVFGQILEILPDHQILVDAGIPIYCNIEHSENKLSMGDWVTWGSTGPGFLHVDLIITEEDILTQDIVAMTDDFRSCYDKK